MKVFADTESFTLLMSPELAGLSQSDEYGVSSRECDFILNTCTEPQTDGVIVNEAKQQPDDLEVTAEHTQDGDTGKCKVYPEPNEFCEINPPTNEKIPNPTIVPDITTPNTEAPAETTAPSTSEVFSEDSTPETTIAVVESSPEGTLPLTGGDVLGISVVGVSLVVGGTALKAVWRRWANR
jgi:hypothetical protein